MSTSVMSSYDETTQDESKSSSARDWNWNWNWNWNYFEFHNASNSDLKESLHHGETNTDRDTTADTVEKRALLVVLLILALMTLMTLSSSVVSPSVRHAVFGTPVQSVAFIGNSILYYYDLPRSLQIVSEYRIQQNSCLSGAGSLVRMPNLQNGMWNRWRGDGAFLYTLNEEDNNNNDNQIWDLGACTMEMLLFGYNHTEAQATHDDFWEYREDQGVTDDDAWVYNYGDDIDPRLNNACAQSQAYLNFLNDLPTSDIRKNPPPQQWDYLVLVDRTVGPKSQQSRDEGLAALEQIYLPFFQRTKATPVFLVSASYWKDRDDDTNDDDKNGDDDDDNDNDDTSSTSSTLDQTPISSWTVQMYQGYKEYAEFVKQALPRSQTPKLVHMGIAYLVVFEENIDLWLNRLFWTDHKHPSPHGSFLESCLLHHAVYGRLPYKSTMIRDDMQTLWNGTRNLMYPRDQVVPFPTKQEAEYLYNVCKRVAGGYTPPTFRNEQRKQGFSLYK
jgi:hypothetical protein